MMTENKSLVLLSGISLVTFKYFSQELERLRSLINLCPSPAIFLALPCCPGMKRKSIKEFTAQQNGGGSVGDTGLWFDTEEGLREVFSQISLPTLEERKTGGSKVVLGFVNWHTVRESSSQWRGIDEDSFTK